MSLGLYSNGMHDFVMRELEVGYRVAHDEDSEYTGFGPLFDLQYAQWVEADQLRLGTRTSSS